MVRFKRTFSASDTSGDPSLPLQPISESFGNQLTRMSVLSSGRIVHLPISRFYRGAILVLAFGRRGGATMIAIALALLTAPRSGNAAGDGGDARGLVHVRHEIETVKSFEAAARR